GAKNPQLFGPLVAVEDPRSMLPGRAQPDIHQGHRGALTFDGARVLHRQVRTPSDLEEALARREAERAPLLHDDRVGPELADRLAERVVEAADERRHPDDRGDADDHAE